MKIISAISGRRILVSPLDWGLGHAARMIPVIRDLEERNHVTILCGPGAYGFLKEELPEMDIRLIDDRKIRYPESRIGLWTILKWIPVMLRNSINEHFSARRIIREMGIDLVISDNRYGLCFRGIDCYIVTHQIYPLLPERLGWLQGFSNWIFLRALSIYNKVLIPDLEEGFALSGCLSDTWGLDPEKFVRIGRLSRFAPRSNNCIVTPKKQKKYDVLVLISG
ncbi:MAG: hypothetical protein MJZ61_07815, partial [Bacteroidales bacterium]|nr:hypothetical protein [Bacteroidales bacterium]